VKVSSTENGVIFSTIVYDVRGSTSDRNCVYLEDIHIDIMVNFCTLHNYNNRYHLIIFRTTLFLALALTLNSERCGPNSNGKIRLYNLLFYFYKN
jgi:hypothetical protein